MIQNRYLVSFLSESSSLITPCSNSRRPSISGGLRSLELESEELFLGAKADKEMGATSCFFVTTSPILLGKGGGTGLLYAGFEARYRHLCQEGWARL